MDYYFFPPPLGSCSTPSGMCVPRRRPPAPRGAQQTSPLSPWRPLKRRDPSRICQQSPSPSEEDSAVSGPSLPFPVPSRLRLGHHPGGWAGSLGLAEACLAGPAAGQRQAGHRSPGRAARPVGASLGGLGQASPGQRKGGGRESCSSQLHCGLSEISFPATIPRGRCFCF